MNLSSSVAALATTTTSALDTLLDDPRSLVRLRILRAARLLIAERGLSVSMEDIAAAADMGRRTMFRYFESHEELIAAAVASALDWYDQQVEMTVDPDQTLEAWLQELAAKIHGIHQRAGLGLWQLAASDDANLSPQLALVNQRRRTARHRTTEAIARAAWTRAGGSGRCSEAVVQACALSISSFATRSMLNDFGATNDDLARCTAIMLASLVRIEVGRAPGAPVAAESSPRKRKGR